LIDHLLGKRQLPSPPLIEFIVDDPVIRVVVEDLLGRQWVDYGPERESQRRYLDNLIEFWRSLGYDFVRFERGLPFPGTGLHTQNTAPGATGDRGWVDESHGGINTWEDFERYPFPKIEDFDFYPFEYLNSHLPEGMGLIAGHGGGFFEHLSWTFSIEQLCLALYDNPTLVEATMQRIGEPILAVLRQLAQLDRVAALFPGDDLGFRTGTLISPANIRRLVLPWHQQAAEIAHRRGIPYFLHSCGNLDKIMDDLIDVVRIDGKHSYEDAILPVAQFQERYGQRVAVLGGLDVHALSTGTPESVRELTRAVIAACGPRGRYAVGSGNSIPDYVPVANYLSMVDETLEQAHRSAS
jgi:uroporphyrinogen decarboxylase